MLFNPELSYPSRVSVQTDKATLILNPGPDGIWSAQNVSAQCKRQAPYSFALVMTAAATPLISLTLEWRGLALDGLRVLGDHWERAYGDLEWHGLSGDRALPWYFLAHDGHRTAGLGVITRPHALCHWIVTPTLIRLVCDLRCGPAPVQLGDRTLPVATVLKHVGDPGQSPFNVACDFCSRLCADPRRVTQTVYGINDWYYAYTNNSRESTLRDTETLAELTAGLPNRPYSVIDAGWEKHFGGPHSGAGPWTQGNAKYGDMKSVADGIRECGVKPGIWIRPLRCAEHPRRKKVDFNSEAGGWLDPTDPAVRESLRATLRTLTQEWGFQLIKHDWSTYDLLNRWGAEAGGNLNWEKSPPLSDTSLTTAEIVMNLYRDIREGAGEKALILACNTIGHLAAGLADIQRVGDDTSGQAWPRTRQMGVNCLAFRMPQHQSFFEADPDCVGLTPQVPWHLNRQWLDAISRSGMPLFVSPHPDSINNETRSALRDAFARASVRQPRGEPLDWLDSPTPRHWRFGDRTITYDWYTT